MGKKQQIEDAYRRIAKVPEMTLDIGDIATAITDLIANVSFQAKRIEALQEDIRILKKRLSEKNGKK